MSSRLTRTLLKLYPRQIRDRYGDELLDLQDELSAQGEVSRMRLIRDMLAGALLVRPARRAYLMTGAVLVISGLMVGGTIIGGGGTDTLARASHPRVRLAAHVITVPFPSSGSCFVADGSSCSLTPCAELTGQPSTEDAVASSSLPAMRIRPRATARCAASPHLRPPRPVFVGQ